jgi:hypothetical protein
LGAGVVAADRAPAAFALDSAPILASAMFLVLSAGVPAAPRRDAAWSTGLADLHLGLVFSKPWLWVSNVTDSGPRNVAQPFPIHDQLGLELNALRIVSGITVAGSVLGAIQLGGKTRLRRRGLLACAA